MDGIAFSFFEFDHVLCENCDEVMQELYGTQVTAENNYCSRTGVYVLGVAHEDYASVVAKNRLYHGSQNLLAFAQHHSVVCLLSGGFHDYVRIASKRNPFLYDHAHYTFAQRFSYAGQDLSNDTLSLWYPGAGEIYSVADDSLYVTTALPQTPDRGLIMTELLKGFPQMDMRRTSKLLYVGSSERDIAPVEFLIGQARHHHTPLLICPKIGGKLFWHLRTTYKTTFQKIHESITTEPFVTVAELLPIIRDWYV